MDLFVTEMATSNGDVLTQPFREPLAQMKVLIDAVKASMHMAMRDESKLDPGVFSIPGMSGKRYRCFINNLIRSLASPRYLEIGSWAGSTLCSAINNNQVMATAIDNWSEFGGPKEAFMSHLNQFRTPRAYVNFIESDFRAVDYAGLGTFNVYLFDGPHERQDQYDGLDLVRSALDDVFVLIVDDWNWPAVRTGTFDAIAACGFTTHYSVELRTTLDDTHPAVHGANSEWHNGYFVGVLSKSPV